MPLYLIPGIFMDVAAMADVVATVAGADGADAVPDGNAHAAFYNTFCDTAF
ncbi:MAG: hypothetical protein J7599_05700 [Niabella sp.]|nr:hypothetical protein [Niabella sp.]